MTAAIERDGEGTMKYICLVYLVEKDMSAMTKKEADACIEESLAYDDEPPGEPAISSWPARCSRSRRRPPSACGAASCPPPTAPSPRPKEQLGGFILIEARDLNEAMQVASKIPMARHGSIEVRPIREIRPVRGACDEVHVHDLPRRE